MIDIAHLPDSEIALLGQVVVHKHQPTRSGLRVVDPEWLEMEIGEPVIVFESYNDVEEDTSPPGDLPINVEEPHDLRMRLWLFGPRTLIRPLVLAESEGTEKNRFPLWAVYHLEHEET